MTLLAASPPQSEWQEKQAHAKQTQRGGEGVAPLVESPHKADDENKPCEPGEDNRKSDLCAQWKAADAAAESAWAAKCGVLIGLLTLGAASAAAYYAKEAARHTKSGAEEARRAADAAISSHGLNEQLERPLFGIKMPNNEFTFVQDQFNVDEIYFKLINTGRSPGRITSIRRCWEATSGKYIYPDAIDPNDPQKGFEKRYPRYVGAGMKTEGIWGRYRGKISNPGNIVPEYVFFHGFIRYEDLTGKRFVSGFCYFIHIADQGEKRFRFAWPSRNPERYHYHYEDKRTEDAADEA